MVVPPRLSDGTTQCQTKVVVPSSNGGGIVSTPKIQDETLFGSIFEVTVGYKYPTLFCMKGHLSVIIILNLWGVKVLKFSSSLF